ncbi:basic phospholipase A2 homolog 1-like isoform X2 [Scyliorhinus canicula]|uniref:basic phospholipase A2 homolog 1-like isoform X2 n=1 Tax=Scyliorhinus canicula TaxID=7830 RepID=UPI0018F64477|nr:basic phospholipase A2 homolog 1-like isoform X2 [Scyliorhinus canicula]
MESPKLTAILIVLGAIWMSAQDVSGQRRREINLQRIVYCVNPSAQPQYSNYGCFCRIGGNGNQPVDDIDRCCQVHDDCYREAAMMECSTFHMWFASLCENGIPKCPEFSVTSHDTECFQKFCNCDIAAALCLKENSDKHNPKFVDYDQSLCKTVP